MSAFLVSLASAFMSFLGKISLLGSDDGGSTVDPDIPPINWGKWQFIETITKAVDTLLVPIMILVGTAGIIYAIVLGVNLARAESTEKRDEAKKRMINAIIGLVSIFLLILLMKLVIAYMPQILGIDVSGPSVDP